MRNFRCTIWSSNIKYNCIRHVMMYSTVLSVVVVALIDVVTIDAVEWWIAKQLAGWRDTLFFFFFKKMRMFFLFLISLHFLRSFAFAIPSYAMPYHVILQNWLFTHLFIFFILSFRRWWNFFAFTRSVYLPVS